MASPTSHLTPAYPSYATHDTSYSSAFPPLQSWPLVSPQTKKHGHPVHPFNTLHQSVAPPKYPPYLKHTKYADLALEHYNYLQSKRTIYHTDNTGTHSTRSRQPPLCALADDVDLRLPSCWNQNDRAANVEVGRNGLDLTYIGAGLEDTDAASIRSNFPMRAQCGVYYYETLICSKGTNGFIGIGLCGPDTRLERLPGWDKGSWGYHGDDGHCFAGSGSGNTYGPHFTTGDIIGCGVNFGDNSVFYTKNGTFLGVAFQDIKEKGPLYPCVGMRTKGERVRTNFGQDPFVFDITHYIEEYKARIRAAVNSQVLTRGDAIVDQLIVNYLAHHGYTGTARAFIANTRYTADKTLSLTEVPNLNERQSIRMAVIAGDIDLAITLTNTYFPSLLETNYDINFQLKCRKFIEMVRKYSELENEQREAVRRQSFMSEDDRMSVSSSSVLTDDMPDTDSGRRRSLNGSSAHTATPSMHVPNAGPRRLSYAAIAAAASPNSGGGFSAFPSSPADNDDDSMWGRRHRRMSNRRSSIGSNSVLSSGSNVAMSYEATLEEEDEDNEMDEDDQDSLGGAMRRIMQFGKHLKAEYGDSDRPFIKSRLGEIFLLLAYPDPGASPVADLMDVSGRDELASELNAAILAYQGQPKVAALERIYQQAVAANKELAYDGDGKAVLVDIAEYLHSHPTTDEN